MEKECAKVPSVSRTLEISDTPPKKIKTAAQKEVKRSNALALEIIQKNLSEAMKNEMKTITSAKELCLSLEQTFKGDERGLVNMMLEDMTDDMKSEVKGYKNFIQLLGCIGMLEPEKPSNTDSEEPSNIEVSNSDEPNNTGKYTGYISEPPSDFIDNDCLKVEKCFYSHYNLESENEKLKVKRCFHSHYNLESENEKSTCYSGHTDFDFGDDECDRNLEDVKYNIMLAFEIISKNIQVNVFRKDIMFVLDKVTNLQGYNQVLQK